MPALSPSSDPDRDDVDAVNADDPAFDDESRRPAADPDVETDSDLVCVTETTAEGIECTIYPENAAPADVMTTWITVDADTTCDLAAWR